MPAIDTTEDARFLLEAVLANEHWTTLGIDETDLARVFEMSALCAYGFVPRGAEVGFSRRRFRLALRALSLSSKVTKRGDRWYSSDSAGLRGATDVRGVRRCARNGCRADIAHLARGHPLLLGGLP